VIRTATLSFTVYFSMLFAKALPEKLRFFICSIKFLACPNFGISFNPPAAKDHAPRIKSLRVGLVILLITSYIRIKLFIELKLLKVWEI